jgi:hypothetical protein
MLGKHGLRSSLLLEVGFMVAVWLVAWLVFDASLAVRIVALFGAFAIAFLYEGRLGSINRRKRAEARRAQRRSGDLYTPPGGQGKTTGTQLPPTSSVVRVSSAESKGQADPVVRRLAEELSRSRIEREAASSAEGVSPVPAEAIPEVPEIPAVEAAGPPDSPGPASEPVSAPQSAPDPQPEPPREVPATEPATEPAAEPESHSRLAEIAAGPDAPKPSHPMGGWNVWRLERLLAAQPKRDPERDYELSLLLVYLREFADSDGQLPPAFDDLVIESFGDLIRGPATP